MRNPFPHTVGPDPLVRPRFRLAVVAGLVFLTGVVLAGTPAANADHPSARHPTPVVKPTPVAPPSGIPFPSLYGDLFSFLPDPKHWAADAFSQLLVTVLQGIDNPLHSSSLGSGLRSATQFAKGKAHSHLYSCTIMQYHAPKAREGGSASMTEGPMMLAEERRRHILGMLQRDGKVLASELSSRLAVSEDTIRRDLRELARGGMLHRVHGGALPRSPVNARYATRREQASEAKVAIGKAAATLARSGQVIIMDAGTTALQVADHLSLSLRATVITNSPPVATALTEHPSIEVLLLGGRLYKHSVAAVGTETVDALRQVRADLCFLSVAGLHPEVGMTVLDHEEAQVKRAMIEGAREVVVVVAGEKLGTAAPYVIAPVGVLTGMVTDLSDAEDELLPYRRMGIEVVRVGGGQPDV